MEVIKSRKNQLVLHMRKLGTDKAYRGETGLYLCQGEKLLYEAIENRAVINEVLYSGTKPVLPEDTRAYPAAFDIL
jgi:tRNA G18 (ribose-2'-O)-methylase SpoU